MSNQSEYTPPKVWNWNPDNGGKWSSINRPTAGARQQQTLPTGKHPLQLYSLATPNGQKVTIMLEELLALGIKEAEYDAYLIDIGEGDQFGSDFVEINPNSKIPALMDYSDDLKGKPQRVFESGAILLYLSEKFDALLPKGSGPKDHAKRTEALSWLFWQMGSAPYIGGGFGHFYSYAPYPMEYPIDRFTMETKRQLDVLDKHLANNEYMAGDEYSIADIAIWPWYGNLVLGHVYDAAEFLETDSYTHLMRWAKHIEQRTAVKRGRMVNRTWGEPHEQLHERHDASDFETKTQGKESK